MELQRIEKEEIVNLHFLPTDVLQNKEQRVSRYKKLMNGAFLGNIEKKKCKIIFHATQGDTYVETTIWAVTDKYICLKGGVYLLIASIIDVVF
jgi:hypothetical protein